MADRSGTIEQKYANKDALRDRLLLRNNYKPVIAYVGRIDRQKGAHLIHHAIFYALAQGAQFVLLGYSADPADNDHFWHLKHYLNDHPDCHLEIGFDQGLAHLIYAGADMMVMPSLFEPCGLSQMIALKYGTVPIVRASGGLVDTVFDRDYSARHPDDRNGYVFHQLDNPALESAMARAIGLWYNVPGRFPAAHADRDAPGSFLGLARPALREHLRLHPPQIGPAHGGKETFMPLFHVTVREHTYTGRFYHDVVEAESFEDALQLAVGRATAPQPPPGSEPGHCELEPT